MLRSLRTLNKVTQHNSVKLSSKNIDRIPTPWIGDDPMISHFVRVLGAIVVVGISLPQSTRASVPAGRYVLDSVGGTVYDTKTKLTWQQIVSQSSTYAWTDAQNHCTLLNVSRGESGWRLPTLKELVSIVEDARISPSIDPTAFPSTPGHGFWSLSRSHANSANAWYVDFNGGSALTSAMSTAFSVRCVRP